MKDYSRPRPRSNKIMNKRYMQGLCALQGLAWISITHLYLITACLHPRDQKLPGDGGNVYVLINISIIFFSVFSRTVIKQLFHAMPCLFALEYR